MFQRSFNLGSLQEIDSCLEDAELHRQAALSRSILIQFFASDLEPSEVPGLHERISASFPQAVVVGVTTAGEIHEGGVIQHRTVAVFSFFRQADAVMHACACRRGEEESVGLRLAEELLADGSLMPIKGLLLYATTGRMNAAGLLGGLQGKFGDAPLFGAGAAAYHNAEQAWVFANGTVYRDGAAIIAFRGSELEIRVHPYLGWEPLSRGMTITEIGDPTLIRTLDGIPAADVYEKYLGICGTERFFEHMLEFPLMVDRQGSLLARVPILREPDGSLRLVADVRVGEEVRLSYGNPKHIVIETSDIERKMGDFRPEGLLLFSCYCRRIYLQEAADRETAAFQKFASSSGLYTYGEFYGQGDNLQLHNATMVAVGMREGASPPNITQSDEKSLALPETETKQMEMTSRLARFIGVVVGELEQANAELREIMQTDSLTGLFNRGQMDKLLRQRIGEMEEGDCLSVILLDVDRFKAINDTYGHLAGDEVLQQTAKILRRHADGREAAGRWGGEEFLLILPGIGSDEAVRIAERIRRDLESGDFGDIERVTASFGVTSAMPGEETRRIFKRADEALYAAKHGGRNRVVSFRS
ncbi:hypothetical protein CDO73_18785 [Saccharibacillus sp. O23]|uniref:sensor domain-containing diguanylate cyclase n=1 Tax=Saccharibacillus sp. O23 TaxID=2009338 RepID=UPI000B4DF1AD|nr:diguanylate cyclase [Saccharibacillus sp. O23]OWR28323.1 hypothetical protein CDO73_18785 [Saccharibacillus sp. O23]